MIRCRLLILVVVFLGQTGYAKNDKDDFTRVFLEVKDDIRYFSYEIAENDIDVVRKKNNSHSKSFVFAVPIKMNIDLLTIGTRISKDSGEYLFIGFTSQGAKSLNIIFNQFQLSNEAYVYLFNPNLTEKVGPLGADYNPSLEFPNLATFPVTGDSIVVGIFMPFEDKNHCVIGQLNHDFIGITKSGGYVGSSATCNIDVECPQGLGWHKEKASVCKILVGGEAFCSGALLNNTLDDGRDYILTAEHCLSQFWPSEQFALKAATSIFIFNYESPWCNGPNGSQSQFVTGSTIRSMWNAITGGTDFALWELNSNVPTDFYTYYSGWSSQIVNPSNSVGIHYPMGDVKKISVENDATTVSGYPLNQYCNTHSVNDYFWKVNLWDWGITEVGSSGSPLYNPDHRVIGQLYAGCITCYNDEPDYYGRLTNSWLGNGTISTSLHWWLDPLGLSPPPSEHFGLRFIRFHTIDDDAWITGDIVRFHDVTILPGHDVVVTELQDRFEAKGTLDIPAGVTFRVEKP